MARKMIETRRRGFFGYVTLTIFWLANGFMALWLIFTISHWGNMGISTMSAAQQTGAHAGIAIGLGILLAIWACVAVITGLLVMMTRGRKEFTEFD